MHKQQPVCLSIGGSDSCGGAGIQADLRVFEALGIHGCSAITALTAQNPQNITRIEAVSLAQLDAEIHAVFDYYDVAVVKTGMLVDAEHVALVSALLQQLHQGPLVIDPVMVASSGKRLLHDGAVQTLLQALLPQATLITPNLDEAAVLLGENVIDLESVDPKRAAQMLSERLGCAILLKGGHADAADVQSDDMLTDVLCDSDGSTHEFTHLRQPWSLGQRHGTGCRLAAGLAAGLANKLTLPQAAQNAIDDMQTIIS